ncbi:NUDIX hydrolase [Litorilinea aerophila]|uniref:NUDIX hydrolase n=1 Tax=Litorilinea aerophila TaxID=1204385 RepID=A0A540VIL7_9CHLR|nr:NUDIX hydrolase [Litorilinea aerophila]MCC9075820.1 NUDIX hydrolase [Litorilinea aerophila]OUC05602.1 ADP-ribose pyrophosphatase [Litorilinea aerophila]GIV77251.1 MAG: ADP-ribose pyrophosphatase [Litorilinea sp.]GIV80517.1 MAG: ADP-ribose pyrophosphatase [Litorilinea sp.]
MNPRWLTWARALQAIAQNGLTYARDPFDVERYQAVREVAAEMFAYHTGEPVERLRALFEQEVGHATPKLDVRGVVFQEGRVLLVRERSDGGWTLPGGWVDIHESPRAAVEREVREESGYETRAVKLLALYDRDRHGHPPHPFHIYKLFFRCEIVGGAPASSVETDGVGFFSLERLPPLSLSRVTAAQLERFFQHEQHPDWPTDFD